MDLNDDKMLKRWRSITFTIFLQQILSDRLLLVVMGEQKKKI